MRALWPLTAATTRPRKEQTSPYTDEARIRGVDCGIQRSGQVVCWGRWAAGPFRYASTPYPTEPTPIREVDDATQLVAGDEQFCALRRSGEVACWGSNDNGQLGIGSDGVDAVPRVVPDLKASKVFVGPRETCALADTKLVCRGGYGVSASDIDASVVEVALGDVAGCSRTARGTVSC
jgi:alpha-tubulin suppressor-like RCC1 family protein